MATTSSLSVVSKELITDDFKEVQKLLLRSNMAAATEYSHFHTLNQNTPVISCLIKLLLQTTKRKTIITGVSNGKLATYKYVEIGSRVL